MASKYRNLIASQVRQITAAKCGGPAGGSNRKLIQPMSVDCDLNRNPHFGIRLPVDSLGIAPGDTQLVHDIVESFETSPDLPFVALTDRRTDPRPTKDRKSRGKERNLANPRRCSTYADFKSSAKDLIFGLSCDRLARQVIKSALVRSEGPGNYEWRRDGLFPDEPERLKVVVELSSPNVAKPFHLGHLRSTIQGNFVANLHQAVGHEVVRLNYLGDWGTQFGYLAYGLEQHPELSESVMSSGDIDDNTAEERIQKLNRLYVEANKTAETDKSIEAIARSRFSRLEQGDQDLVRQWRGVRELTVAALAKTYRRLNVHIDHYHGESMYPIDRALAPFQNRLQVTEEGKKVVDIGEGLDPVTVVKSDGSSLYITRDVAAALHRKEIFEFDRMLYVVEAGQQLHFRRLQSLLSVLGHGPLAESIEHVGFGKIRGLSTRQGTATFLSDILDEAIVKMREQQNQSINTKSFDETTTDILATTAVSCNDLKARRKDDYDFSWERALQSTGNKSGIRLQYNHARLASLIEKNKHSMFGDQSVLEFTNDLERMSLLKEKHAINVIFRLSVFEESLRDCYVNLEASTLVNYLQDLASDTSKALAHLGVKDAPDRETARQRLALFAAAKSVLHQGLKILGFVPLDKM